MNSITVNTPIGNYIVEESEGFITSVRRGEVRVGGNTTPLLLKAKNQLKEYFAGKRKKFDLPLKPEGTDFQKQVWLALESIPFGETASYLDIANGIKNPKAVRAVGGANGKNPIAIIIPCHRIINSNGSLGGYNGGIEIKQALIKIENI